MRGEDGDPLHDLADVCNYNESLIVDAVNQERAEASAPQVGASRNAAKPARAAVGQYAAAKLS